MNVNPDAAKVEDARPGLSGFEKTKEDL